MILDCIFQHGDFTGVWPRSFAGAVGFDCHRTTLLDLMSPLVDIIVIIVFLVLVLTDLERVFASLLACFVRDRLCCSILAQVDRLRLQGSRTFGGVTVL